MATNEIVENTEVYKQLESIFPDIKKEKTNYGERWILNDSTVFYLDEESTGEGHIFKDDKSYNEDMDAICYISQYSYEDYEQEIKSYIQDYLDGDITIEDLCDGISESAKDYGDTHRDFLRASNQQEDIASLVFETVDWQSIGTLIDDLFQSNELEEYEGILVYTRGMEIKEYLYDEYKKEWLSQHQPPTYEEFLNKEFKDTNYVKALIDKVQGVQLYKEKEESTNSFYNEANIHHLESIVNDIQTDKAHFEEHELIEDEPELEI